MFVLTAVSLCILMYFVLCTPTRLVFKFCQPAANLIGFNIIAGSERAYNL